MAHRLPTTSRHIVDRMRLLMEAGVRKECKWLTPLMAAELEYGPTTRNGARPAFTTLNTLTTKYKTHLGLLAPVRPDRRPRSAAPSSADIAARPHTAITFPEDRARRLFFEIQTTPALKEDGSVWYDGRRMASRPRASLLDHKPFAESEAFIRRVEQEAPIGSTQDVSSDALARAMAGLQAKLAKETQDSTAAQAAKTMVDSAEMTPIISQSIESLFALMDKNRAEGSADSTKASSSASSASTPTPGSSES
eukprot:m.417074 g.417074  ORF g.417074 m.417074 type:complete len:251 (-) comp30252_c0_seq1:1730-2482(-)